MSEIIIGQGQQSQASFAEVDALASQVTNLILGSSEGTEASFDTAMNALVSVVSALIIAGASANEEAARQVTNEFGAALRDANAIRLHHLAITAAQG